MAAEARQTQHSIQTSLINSLFYGVAGIGGGKGLPFTHPITEYINTPNLGTSWDINYVALSFPVATVGFSMEKGLLAGKPIGFALRVTLLIANVPVYTELIPINNILVPAKEKGVFTEVKETAVAGNLQFPQTPRAFGGQGIEIQVEGVITMNGEKSIGKLKGGIGSEYEYNGFLYLATMENKGFLLSDQTGNPPGQITMGYTRNDYHKQ